MDLCRNTGARGTRVSGHSTWRRTRGGSHVGYGVVPVSRASRHQDASTQVGRSTTTTRTHCDVRVLYPRLETRRPAHLQRHQSLSVQFSSPRAVVTVPTKLNLHPSRWLHLFLFEDIVSEVLSPLLLHLHLRTDETSSPLG